MKEYIAPRIMITEYDLSDIIASSLPNSKITGSETVDEFSYNDNPATEETTLPDWIAPTDDDWW